MRYSVQEFVSAKRYYVLLVLCLVIVAIVTLSITLTVQRKEELKPHVVLIIADDMGYNDIGYYNQHDDIRTPYLDKIASEGMKLNNYYAQSVCTPARAALFTGRYPYRYGMQGARPILYGAKTGLPLEEQTIAEVMKNGGYKTSLVGKWHLGYSKWDYTPIKRGYDYFFGMYGGFADYFTHVSAEPESKFGNFDLHEHRLNADGTFTLVNTTEKVQLINETYGVYSERLFTNKATEIILNHAGKDPLFLTVSYMNPHSPLQALDEDLARVPPTVKNEIRRNFSALMSSLDYGVQQVDEALKARGMYENTLFIFTGDNGGAVQGPGNSESLGGTNYPLRGGKWTMWEGGVKVPAFIRGPKIPVNSTSNGLFHITDWLPTLATIARVKSNAPKLDGVDQLALLREHGPSNRREIILELDPVYKQAAIIRDNFKLLIGEPGAKPYNDVYQPLKGNETWYFDGTPLGEKYGRTMYSNVSYLCGVKKYEYLNQRKTNSSYDFRDLANIGALTPDNVRLYDLDYDPSETYDLYTDEKRFSHVVYELYNALAAAAKDMADVIFYMGDYRDVNAAYEEIQAGGIAGEIRKCRPWLT